MGKFVTQYPVIEAENGEQFIQCCYRDRKCGCKIVGGGTLQQPLEIKFCKTHKTCRSSR